ncbi:MAG: hypothetical protein M1825_002591 [Sarcosagium campestre]|nr:MAG: hypothetical protein M1825_002591 [Sarcosagium campestre]
MSGLAPLVVPAVKKHTATVIMLHGLGDSGAGWTVLANQIRQSRPKLNEVSFIFPNAPTIPITANGGYRMPGWYDIKSFSDLNQKSSDASGILASRDRIHELIAAESSKNGIPADRVVLGGFSQGGALSLLAGITAPAPLAGIFAMSGYMLLGERIPELIPSGAPNKATRVWMGHGADDPLVKCQWGRLTAEKLREFGVENVQFNEYPNLEHSASEEELSQLEDWLEKRLPPLSDASQA